VDGVGVFTLTEQRKSATFPLSQEVRYTLMAMPEGTFVESFWQSAFEVLSKEIEPPAVLQRHAAYLKRLLAPSLIPEKDWILLSVGSRPIEFPSDSLLRAEGQQHDDLLYLSSGCASVEKVRWSCCCAAITRSLAHSRMHTYRLFLTAQWCKSARWWPASLSARWDSSRRAIAWQPQPSWQGRDRMFGTPSLLARSIVLD